MKHIHTKFGVGTYDTRGYIFNMIKSMSDDEYIRFWDNFNIIISLLPMITNPGRNPIKIYETHRQH
jgi:hypothetical protein